MRKTLRQQLIILTSNSILIQQWKGNFHSELRGDSAKGWVMDVIWRIGMYTNITILIQNFDRFGLVYSLIFVILSRYLFIELLVFILGALSLCRLYDLCEFILTSVLRFLGLERSSLSWILMNFHSSAFLDIFVGVTFLMIFLR